VPWWEPFAAAWKWYSENREPLTPIGAFLGGGIIAWAALRQARTATRQAATAAEQAETARFRHEEQTRADLQRRITESFSKAAEQLGSDKIEARLGGIYMLERISKESMAEYWTVLLRLLFESGDAGRNQTQLRRIQWRGYTKTKNRQARTSSNTK
jgi:hypothetical protein